jgi:hypothetical protein
MMQKVQMGGGFISPTVTKHVQKNAMQLKPTEPNSKQTSSAQIGGGFISPNVKKHVAASAKVNMGGGLIHPNIAKHVQTQ